MAMALPVGQKVALVKPTSVECNVVLRNLLRDLADTIQQCVRFSSILGVVHRQEHQGNPVWIPYNVVQLHVKAISNGILVQIIDVLVGPCMYSIDMVCGIICEREGF